MDLFGEVLRIDVVGQGADAAVVDGVDVAVAGGGEVVPAGAFVYVCAEAFVDGFAVRTKADGDGFGFVQPFRAGQEDDVGVCGDLAYVI